VSWSVDIPYLLATTVSKFSTNSTVPLGSLFGSSTSSDKFKFQIWSRYPTVSHRSTHSPNVAKALAIPCRTVRAKRIVLSNVKTYGTPSRRLLLDCVELCRLVSNILFSRYKLSKFILALSPTREKPLKTVFSVKLCRRSPPLCRHLSNLAIRTNTEGCRIAFLLLLYATFKNLIHFFLFFFFFL